METGSAPGLHVLLVEDSEHDARAVRRALEKGSPPCRVTHCVRAEEALERLAGAARWYDVVLVDHGLPGMSGLDFAKRLVAGGTDIPIVMLTGGGGELVAVEAMKAGVADYLVKDANRGYLDLLSVVLPQVVGAHEDRIAREKAEQALRESQELFRSFMDNSPAIAYMKQEDGTYVYVNKPFERLFNMTEEEWKGRTDVEIWGEEIARQLRENDLAVLAAGQTLEVQESLPREDGLHHWLAFKFPIGSGPGRHVGGMAVDITETKRSEEEKRHLEVRIQQAQKLESLGVMAGGIAHDFNNLLVSILGNAGLARLEFGEETPARKYLQQIEKACLKAAELTDQMLAYAGKANLELEATDLSALVEELAFVLKVSISKKAQLKLDLDTTLPTVEADPTHVRQVVGNLVSNASEALGPEGGTITIRTGTVEADRAYLSGTALGETLPEGSYVYLEVEDTGAGMDAETRGRIFDPFFTTKFTRRGLGLASALGVMRAHRGAIRVDSEPGGGTTFRILFPAADRAVDGEAVPSALAAGLAAGGLVLVADEEQDVRDVAAMTLDRFGYAVLTAPDGASLVEQFREHSGSVTAVLLDIALPGPGADEVLRQLRDIRSDVRVIVTSGYDGDGTARFAGVPVAAFLKKPYRPLALVKVIQSLS